MNLPHHIHHKFPQDKTTDKEQVDVFLRRLKVAWEHTRLYKFCVQPVSLSDSIGIGIFVSFVVVMGLMFVHQLSNLKQDFIIVKAEKSNVNMQFIK